MNNKTIIKFDYTKEFLESLKEKSTETLKTKDLVEVKTQLKEIVSVRQKIKKKGKEYRDEANAFNKKVLEVEKNYLSIIAEPEEFLKNFISEEERKAILKIRKEKLPERQEKLKKINFETTDEVLLEMSDEEYNEFLAEKLGEYQAELDRKAKEIEDEKQKQADIERAKEEAEKKAREDERKKIEKEKADKEAEEKEKVEEEKKKQEEELKNEKLKTFLKENNFDKEKDILKRTEEGVYRIYKLKAEIKI